MPTVTTKPVPGFFGESYAAVPELVASKTDRWQARPRSERSWGFLAHT